MTGNTMTKDVPHILLVNPWIHDFAAYDLSTPTAKVVSPLVVNFYGRKDKNDR